VQSRSLDHVRSLPCHSGRCAQHSDFCNRHSLHLTSNSSHATLDTRCMAPCASFTYDSATLTVLKAVKTVTTCPRIDRRISCRSTKRHIPSSHQGWAKQSKVAPHRANCNEGCIMIVPPSRSRTRRERTSFSEPKHQHQLQKSLDIMVPFSKYELPSFKETCYRGIYDAETGIFIHDSYTGSLSRWRYIRRLEVDYHHPSS
jgi:hypothetical protein